jgi:hypothetical protein
MAQIFGFAPARLQEAALASKVMRARLLPAFKPTQPGALPGVNGTFRFIKSEFSGLFRQFTAAATPPSTDLEGRGPIADQNSKRGSSASEFSPD